MKTFVKWTKNALFLFVVMFLVLFISDRVETNLIESVLTILVASVLLGAFFYLVEEKYFPIRKKKLLKKIEKIFNAEIISDSQASFRYGRYDVLINIDFILSFSKYAANGEVISFHIGKNIFHHVHVNKPLSKIEDYINGNKTYRIYQTNGMGLNLAKKRIEKGLSA